MKNSQYVEPELEVIYLESVDVITESDPDIEGPDL